MYQFKRKNCCEINILQKATSWFNCKLELYTVHFDQARTDRGIYGSHDDHQTYCWYAEASMFLPRIIAVVHLHFTSFDVSKITSCNFLGLNLHWDIFNFSPWILFTMGQWWSCHTIPLVLSNLSLCNRPYIISQCGSTLFNFWVSLGCYFQELLTSLRPAHCLSVDSEIMTDIIELNTYLTFISNYERHVTPTSWQQVHVLHSLSKIMHCLLTHEFLQFIKNCLCQPVLSLPQSDVTIFKQQW